MSILQCPRPRLMSPDGSGKYETAPLELVTYLGHSLKRLVANSM